MNKPTQFIPTQFIEMKNEWEGWQRIVTELKKCSASIDINEEPRLTAAIQMWGELLVELRVAQPEGVRTAAQSESIDRYNALR